MYTQLIDKKQKSNEIHRIYAILIWVISMPWVTKNSTESYEPIAPAREYTEQEKAQNWWHYHKFHVLIAVVTFGVAVWFLSDLFLRTEPDYQIGYVGPQELSPSVADALAQELAAFGEDRNGDGQVIVAINQFALDFAGTDADEYDAAERSANTVRLTAELSSDAGNYIFLLADPEGFQRQLGALQNLDGSLPPEDAVAAEWDKTVYRWDDCPVLTELAFGSADEQAEVNALYIGRRACFGEEQQQAFSADEQLWLCLTAQAAK